MTRKREIIVKPTTISAPIGGLNTTDSLMAMPPLDAVKLTNMIAGENGLRPRSGYVEWCTGIGAPDPIRTMLSLHGADPAENKLFAITFDKIYDVTASSAAPGSVVTLPATDSKSGYCEALSFVTTADRYVILCDETNGYYTRAESTGTWLKVTAGAGAGQVNGADPTQFVQPCSHNGRLWFVIKNTTKACFLDPASVYGVASIWDFGQQFTKGGALAALFRWTRDGGSGMDDRLVAISTVGEVVVYEGTDPATYGAWKKAGGWYVGAVPAGRRLASEYGGDLLINTAAGALPLSILVAGRALTPDVYASAKVKKLFASYMTDRRASIGWSILPVNSDNILVFTIPLIPGEDNFQLALSLDRGAWSEFKSVPITHGVEFEGVFYFGTSDGRVCKYRGDVDNVARDGSSTQNKEIKFFVLPAFTSLGSALKKQIQHVEVLLISYGLIPNYKVEARWDFNQDEIVVPVGGTGSIGCGGVARRSRRVRQARGSDGNGHAFQPRLRRVFQAEDRVRGVQHRCRDGRFAVRRRSWESA